MRQLSETHQKAKEQMNQNLVVLAERKSESEAGLRGSCMAF